MQGTRKRWTEQEDRMVALFINYRRFSLTKTDPIIISLVEKTGRTYQSVTKHLSNIGYKKEWEKFVYHYSRTHTIQETADRVEMSPSGVEKVILRYSQKNDVKYRKRPRIDNKHIELLMKTSNLESYNSAQFIAKTNFNSSRLFEKKFGISSKWFHGLSVYDYFDLFGDFPKEHIKTTILMNNSNYLLAPWYLLPETELPINKDIEVIKKYQSIIHNGKPEEELKKLVKSCNHMKTNITFKELKELTKEAFESFKVIRSYIDNNYTKKRYNTKFLMRSSKEIS